MGYEQNTTRKKLSHSLFKGNLKLICKKGEELYKKDANCWKLG
jgi:hypothetical protein